jgi:hypothetical protein
MTNIVVISNPYAGLNKQYGWWSGKTPIERIEDTVKAYCKGRHPYNVTHIVVHGIDAYSEAVNSDAVQKADIVISNGGDGTLEQLITHLQETEASPRIVPARGGTANLVAEMMSVPKKGLSGRIWDWYMNSSPAEYVLKETVRQFGEIDPKVIRGRYTQKVGTLRVTTDERMHYGFLFGFGVVSNFFKRYEDKDIGMPKKPGKGKAGYLIAEGIASVAFSWVSKKARTLRDYLLEPTVISMHVEETQGGQTSREGQTEQRPRQYLGAGAMPFDGTFMGLDIFYGITEGKMKFVYADERCSPFTIVQYILGHLSIIKREKRRKNSPVREVITPKVIIKAEQSFTYILGGDTYTARDLTLEIGTQTPFLQFKPKTT